ncbi:MAG: hypothetical protein K8F52_05140 [Candidatus Scalindua rubra]|uniref:Uncharacterized protein n=1 Tax=Candidatus Scalindua brodae TaxID=237368 RepID=A0A0B0ES00_9BACT|nr:MAG: hypothetical protein SCABRO_00325 [Candidatus Scalindua brodae]MBZ0108031.1 hypothetical protein [Candidatus Scalindua rubra]TWU29105.1 hypothetical protein S225a_26290 [Candidatus Brocadiaceae bacterium S225]
MRYSETEAMAIMEQLRELSIDDLDTLFNRETLPLPEELEGETTGAILALNPENPLWLKCVIKIAFKSPLGQWTGKKFLTPFNENEVEKGHGINLFKSRYFPQLFKFDTYTKNAYVDDKPCLALDYREYRSLAFGLVDEVRKIREGLVLGRAYYKFPWKKRMWFVGYFALCALDTN